MLRVCIFIQWERVKRQEEWRARFFRGTNYEYFNKRMQNGLEFRLEKFVIRKYSEFVIRSQLLSSERLKRTRNMIQNCFIIFFENSNHIEANFTV